MKRKMLPALAALVVLVGTQGAKAAIETFDFTVTATSGSLNGTSASGSFSFDSSIIPAGGGDVISNGLLKDLAFTWHGISYTAATANTGDLRFDASGALTGAIFGNDCTTPGVAPNCEIVFGQETWAVAWFSALSQFNFDYSTPSDAHLGLQKGTSAITPASAVPEPASLALFTTGLLGLACIRRRSVSSRMANRATA